MPGQQTRQRYHFDTYCQPTLLPSEPSRKSWVSTLTPVPKVDFSSEFYAAVILSRVADGHRSKFKTSDGRTFLSRRFLPLGKDDRISLCEGGLWVHVKRDDSWIEMSRTWECEESITLCGNMTSITFKEIETEAELNQYEILQNLHYRGAGGAGRTVPIIAKSGLWDLPPLLGFIEVSSSMIANSARKRFFDFPYREGTDLVWKKWDRVTAREYSNKICRISRFVIHPEIRGLGLAKSFVKAAMQFAAERWHYGGFRPRFMEITADMLRYYRFLSEHFVFVGETQGNEHRLRKDMQYLVRRALTANDLKGMPQGGGGIMTLQRSYATKLLKYAEANRKTLPEVIDSLKYDASALDQKTWEALHKLNRRPKPCYLAGITENAQNYVRERRNALGQRTAANVPAVKQQKKQWELANLTIRATAKIAQSKEARTLQDSFGFVGSELDTIILQPSQFTIRSGEITLICGASGSGKSLLLDCIRSVCSEPCSDAPTVRGELFSLAYSGRSNQTANVAEMVMIPSERTPLDLMGRTTLDEFLAVTAQLGLAEPQLLVRPNETLSSGQRYRLQMALACLQRPDVLLVDNFCENLDRYTIAAVCKGLQRLVSHYNIALVTATAAYDRVQESLGAGQTVMLKRGDYATVTEHNQSVNHEI